MRENTNKNVHFLSGEELADLVGCGDIYRHGNIMNLIENSDKGITIMEKDLNEDVAEALNKVK